VVGPGWSEAWAEDAGEEARWAGLRREKGKGPQKGGVGLGQAVSWVGLGFESSSFLFLFYF